MRLLNQSNTTTSNNGAPAGPDSNVSDLKPGRSVPESPEAEAAVLGSMILDHESIGQVVQLVGRESFYRVEHRAIFDSLICLYEDINRVDLVLLRDELKKHNKLAEAGGVDYLVRVAESVPSAANAEYYAQIVKEKAILRELIVATGEILEEAHKESGNVSDKLDMAERKIFAVTERKISGAVVPIKGLLQEAFEKIEAREGIHITGLETGFTELDGILCGLQKGEMIIVAGRPSMGKTSFALNIAEQIGAHDDKAVAIFSLEMGRHQLVERFLCSYGGIDSQHIRRGNLSQDELEKLRDTASALFEKPIFIDDTPGMTPLEIRAKCRRLKSHHDIQVVFIDYLQLMSLGGRVESRQQEVSTMSRYLKELARELDIPVVVLSQLNRSAEGREGHRPRMSDLRESGSIEQDADVVLLLHREDYYHRGEADWEDNNTAEIIVAKQRNGPTGLVKLIFEESSTRFKTMSYVPEPQGFNEPF